jgi:hypothetical protein
MKWAEYFFLIFCLLSCRADKATAESPKAVKGGCAVAYPPYPSATLTFTVIFPVFIEISRLVRGLFEAMFALIVAVVPSIPAGMTFLPTV